MDRESLVCTMSNHRIIVLLIVVCFIIPLLGFAWLVNWTFNRPRWELSAKNVEAGVHIEIFKQNEANPTYSTVLIQRKISRNIERVTIDDLPPEIGETIFTDESLKPGRWTLVIDGVEVDIMPARLVIDRKTEILRPEY